MAGTGGTVKNVTGEPLWQIREGSPRRYTKEAGTWRDFPKELNYVAEQAYINWKIIMQSDDNTLAQADGYGAVYSWPNKNNVFSDYYLHFDRMTQQRGDDPPLASGRLVILDEEEPPTKTRRVESEEVPQHVWGNVQEPCLEEEPKAEEPKP